MHIYLTKDITVGECVLGIIIHIRNNIVSSAAGNDRTIVEGCGAVHSITCLIMAEHNKITFVKEYCKCRRIPCRFRGESFDIGDIKVKFGSIHYYSAYNFSYTSIHNPTTICSSNSSVIISNKNSL